jgi:hypothetical protein
LKNDKVDKFHPKFNFHLTFGICVFKFGFVFNLMMILINLVYFFFDSGVLLMMKKSYLFIRFFFFC